MCAIDDLEAFPRSVLILQNRPPLPNFRSTFKTSRRRRRSKAIITDPSVYLSLSLSFFSSFSLLSASFLFKIYKQEFLIIIIIRWTCGSLLMKSVFSRTLSLFLFLDKTKWKLGCNNTAWLILITDSLCNDVAKCSNLLISKLISLMQMYNVYNTYLN